MKRKPLQDRSLQATAASYSFLWLFVANLVGLLLATGLIWPGIWSLLGPFSYGRWMPLHMDWHLYGWCSLPIIGLLMAFFFRGGKGSTGDAHLGFLAWSGALLLMGVYCLSGITNGKLFLNFAGLPRIVFPAVQVFLWLLFAGHTWKRYKSNGGMDWISWIQCILLAGLAGSPVALWVAMDPHVYPPVDPDSGGATGHSLLASSLGILVLFWAMPHLLQTPACRPLARVNWIYGAAAALSWGAWAILDHGHASNTQPGQIAGLAILLAWIPVLIFYYKAFAWRNRIWLYAFLGWWAFLTMDGFLIFLPGVLDYLKFTNALVAHSHLAMAGMLSAFNMLILDSLGESREHDPWNDKLSFFLWNAGTAAYVVTMSLQGLREGADPSVTYGGDVFTNYFYGMRLLSGLLMMAGAVRWIRLLAFRKQEVLESVGTTSTC